MEYAQEDELQSVDEYREQFVNLVIAQDEDVEEIIDDVRGETESLVKKNSGAEVRHKEKIDAGFKPIMALWAGLYIPTLIKYNSLTGGIIGAQQKQIISNTYHNANFNALARKASANLGEDLKKSLIYRKFPSDGLTIGQRVKTIQGESVKTMRDILTVGIGQGKSAQQIASDLDNFIKPSTDKSWVGPFDWFRDRFGYKVKRVPAGKPAGSLYFNSLRIARTEINHTYRQSTLKFHDKEPWVKGYNWELSPAHPRHDICDDWASGGPYKKDEIEGLGHPNCMCYISVDLVKASELGLDEVGGGEEKEGDEGLTIDGKRFSETPIKYGQIVKIDGIEYKVTTAAASDASWAKWEFIRKGAYESGSYNPKTDLITISADKLSRIQPKVEVTGSIKSALDSWTADNDPKSLQNVLSSGDANKVIAENQKYLNLSQGKSITLYRGVMDVGEMTDAEYNSLLNGIEKRGFLSYTSSPETAREFAGENGVVVKKVIKTEDILFSPNQNFGHWGEDEFIVKYNGGTAI